MSVDSFSRSSTGQVYAPVCIGDLEAHDFKVSANELTEKVARYLQEHPEVPGVMLTENGKLAGVIPRYEIFERLGRQYGVELFLRKPIAKLKDDLKTEVFTLPAHLRVEVAIERALKRNPQAIYDPVVVMDEDGNFCLMDIYTILLVQSQILENLNGVMNSLGRLENVIQRESHEVALKTIMDSLRQVVPFHHASLLLLGFDKDPFMQILNGIVHFPGKLLEKNPVYRSIFEHQQTICLEDAQLAPAWQGVNGSAKARSWMGIPLVDNDGFLGILSLSRYVTSPFSNNERDMSVAFAWYFSQVLSDMLRPHRDENFPLKAVEIKKERFQQPALRAIKKSTSLTL